MMVFVVSGIEQANVAHLRCPRTNAHYWSDVECEHPAVANNIYYWSDVECPHPTAAYNTHTFHRCQRLHAIRRCDELCVLQVICTSSALSSCLRYSSQNSSLCYYRSTTCPLIEPKLVHVRQS